MLCPSCNERKARRACPALSRDICTVCCATKREIEIRCPPDCTYLLASRRHPPAVVQRQLEADVQFLAPFTRLVTERQYFLGLLLFSGTAPFRRTSIPPIVDEDVADAAGALASTLETAGRGIIYDHQPTSLSAQRLGAEWRRLLAELEGERPGRLARDAAAALRLLEQGARAAATTWPGQATAFIGLLERLIARSSKAPQEPADPSAEPTEAPRIVLSE